MDTEAEAGDSRSDDCPTGQSIAASLSDERLQCELHAVNIEDRAGSDDESDDNCNIVSDSCMNFTESTCTASDCDTKTPCLTCRIDYNDSLSSSELKDTELLNSENSTKDAENDCCFIHVDTAEDDEVTDYCMQHMRLADKSVSVIDFNDDKCSESPRLKTSECHECDEVTSATHQFGDDLGQSFIVSPESQTHCTSSLQDAFMQFLKKKQVS